jgi:hypothetical protein
MIFCTQIGQGFSRGVGAGLFNLFVIFWAIGEPTPTGLLKMVQDVGRDTALLCPNLYQLFLDSHAGRKHFRYANNWQLIQNFRRKSIDEQIATSL